MEQAGLETSIDAAGNLYGTLRGSGRSNPVLVGSHIDTVQDGGLYDGPAGVAAALEVAALARQSEDQLPFDLQVVDCLCEEPSDFGLSCIGSRGAARELTAADLARKDPSGRTLRDVIAAAGGDPDAIISAPPDLAPAAFLELHIEQGRRLEQSGRRLAVVDGVVGIRRWWVRFSGRSGHAGTTPMDERADALAAAAEVILAVEMSARRRAETSHFVATVGRLEVRPGAPNVIPGNAAAWVEARSMDDSELDGFAEQLAAAARRRPSIDAAVELESRAAPVSFDPGLRRLLHETAAADGIAPLDLSSAAGHDAAHMAGLGPSAMVFIPCRNGISHAPEEHAEVDDIAIGAHVLWQAVRLLAARTPMKGGVVS